MPWDLSNEGLSGIFRPIITHYPKKKVRGYSTYEGVGKQLASNGHVDLRPSKNLLVAAGCCIPRRVATHACELHLLELLTLVTVAMQGHPEGMHEALDIGILECPACAFCASNAVMIRHIQHSVSQATGLVSNHWGSVRHCIQLVQATWLKAAGHHEQVSSRCDLVGDRDVESHVCSDLVVESRLRPLEPILELLLAGSKEHYLHILRRQPVHSAQDEVCPLLVIQSTNEPNERHIRTNG
mmetsp:Transcript_3654/g.6664  ORF Transcript_3654/g.6664 Transcript_3654/m.6664 type:complete len:240 (-) Transcript_3654:1463-2182(-)